MSGDAFRSMEVFLFGWTLEEAKAEDKCIRCRKDIESDTLAPIDKDEYDISGLCSECFEHITYDDDEEDGDYYS